MHPEPILPMIVTTMLAILIVGLIIKRFAQPHVVAYLLVGFLLGPTMFGFVTDIHLMQRFGSVGVVLLLFFAALEINPQRFAANWRIPILGGVLQILTSVGVMALVSYFFGWPLSRSILFGFVISLSSTAVVIKLLEEWHELNTRIGQDVLGILLMQDLTIIPMLIVLGFVSGGSTTRANIYLQLIGGVGIAALAAFIKIKRHFHLPYHQLLAKDRELQVFAALIICFGLAALYEWLDLSAAFGGFVAGILVGSARETDWVRQSLSSLRIIFIALFFVSMGMLIDVNFIIANSIQVSVLVLAALMTNTLLNAGILRVLGRSWRSSLYGGSLLAQMGEFSFVLAAAGYHMKIVDLYSYNMTLAVVSISLAISPFWIALFKSFLVRT